MENQGKLVWQRNNSFSGKILRKNKSVGYIKNSKKGIADILIFTKNGRTIHLEVKTLKGKMSEDQKQHKKKLEALGHEYYIIRDVEKLHDIL